MIVLRNVSKVFPYHRLRKVVIKPTTITFPTGKSIALFGRNGAGKSTLLKMIAGLSAPTTGEILSTGNISFPVGIGGSPHPDLTGAQNTRFVARLYGADTDELMKFVEDFAELGEHFHSPVRSYSSGMKARLGFGINMGLKFDTYLIDEATATGDAAFLEKSRVLFQERMQGAGAIFVTHAMGHARKFCESGAVLENGELTYYDDLEEAMAAHKLNLGL